MDKFQPLRDAGTNGANYDLDTEAIVAKLAAWDQAYGIEIDDVAGDRVKVEFRRLPADVGALAKEIYDFCPDTIDQHFGCFAELVETMAEAGEDLPPNVQELIEGVDLEAEDYGLVLLERSLRRDRVVALWWD